MRFLRSLATAPILSLLVACGGPAEEGTVPQAQPAAATDADIGDYIVHFNAQTTDQLAPEVARAYGITRSRQRAMLTVSILKKGTMTSVPGDVDVRTVNLAGQPKNFTMEEKQEQDAFYYIGHTGIAPRETLIFTIRVTPEGRTETSEIRFTREFYAD